MPNTLSEDLHIREGQWEGAAVEAGAEAGGEEEEEWEDEVGGGGGRGGEEEG